MRYDSQGLLYIPGRQWVQPFILASSVAFFCLGVSCVLLTSKREKPACHNLFERLEGLPWLWLRVHLAVCVCTQSLSHVQLFATPWTIAHQAPLFVGFSRQEYWSGLSFPLPGDLPNPGINPMFPALAGRLFTTEPPCKATCNVGNAGSIPSTKVPQIN